MIELIILVDYENVQPAAEDLADLEVGKHLLKVFHGPGQNSMPIKLATTLMPVGAAVEFIQCEKAGKDALDFHLSFHFGRLSVQHPQAQYVIVSRDRKGFAQLIEHGSKLGIKVTLVPSLRDEDMNDDGTPVVRTEAASRETRETRETREPRAPRSRAGSKGGRGAAAPAAQGPRRGGRDSGRDSARRDDQRPAPRAETRPAPVVQAPAPVPAPIVAVAPPQVDDDTRDAVEQLMADIVASDSDDAPEVSPAPAPAPTPAPAAKKAPAGKAAAKKAVAKKVVAKKAPAKKAAGKAASKTVEAKEEPVDVAPAPAKKVARKTVAKTATKTATQTAAKAIEEVQAEAPVAAPVPAKKAARKTADRKTAARKTVAEAAPVAVAAPAAAPAPQPAPAPAPSGRQLRDEPMPSDTRKALDSLKRLGDGKRPVKVASLRSHLRSHLRADLSEAGVEALLDQMRAQGWISELDHGKVGYQLP